MSKQINMISEALVTGVVKVVEEPQLSHYHEGRVYSSVKVVSKRNISKDKLDYIRIYFDQDKFDPELFEIDNIITYEGSLIKSKITESLSDVAVSLRSANLADEGVSETGSVVTLKGSVVKVGNESVSGDVTSVSILVMVVSNDGKKVVVKLTGVGKSADLMRSLVKDDMIDVVARIYSYQIKNRQDLANHHLHDSRVISIKKLVGGNGE